MGEVVGVDGVAPEFLVAVWRGDDSVVDWLVGLLDIYAAYGDEPEDWQNACGAFVKRQRG